MFESGGCVSRKELSDTETIRLWKIKKIAVVKPGRMDTGVFRRTCPDGTGSTRTHPPRPFCFLCYTVFSIAFWFSLVLVLFLFLFYSNSFLMPFLSTLVLLHRSQLVLPDCSKFCLLPEGCFFRFSLPESILRS